MTPAEKSSGAEGDNGPFLPWKIPQVCEKPVEYGVRTGAVIDQTDE